MDKTRWNEIQAIILLAIAILIFISLATFDPSDLGFFTSKPNPHIKNFAGIFGAYLAGFLFFSMGFAAYIIPILVLTWAIARFSGIAPQKLYIKTFGTFFLILASSTIFSIFGKADKAACFRFGGIVGLSCSDILIKYLGNGGALLIIALLFLLSMLLATEFLVLPFLSGTLKKVKVLSSNIKERLPKREEMPTFTVKRPKPLRKKEEGVKVESLPKIEPVKDVKVSEKVKTGEYKLPRMDLLDSPPPIEERKIKEDFEANARILEETLRDFDIEAKVVTFNKGPVITRYELEPAPGVKIHRITSLSDNIALAMKAQSVRVVAPIPGKGTIGIEVPNSISTLVYLKEVLDSKEYKESKSKLKLALGKDIAGSAVVADLATMPHLLIAGATGSGKTVCVNSLVMSLLFNSTPDEVKFIMIDPKRVELAIFNDLPHLLSPIVTEPKKVASGLDWVVNEMESRYELFAKAGVRNIDLYNEKIGKDSRLPYIVVIIDELADLMMVAQQDVEGAITRLAQLSRAVGIHIIIATQRPSVDVITGVIKANFPARISFKVASKVDSRTVIDMNGADKLLGKGDMLFIEPGASRPIRAQGSLIKDLEIERITNFIKSQRSPEYVEEILEAHKRPSFKKFEKDEVYEEAVRCVLETRQASVSILQRRLGLGYTRAARLIDMMEDEGIVGPYQGSKPRDILVSLEEYQAKSGKR